MKILSPLMKIFNPSHAVIMEIFNLSRAIIYRTLPIMMSELSIDSLAIEDEENDNNLEDINFEIMQSDSKYITEDKMNNFFDLKDTAFLNFLHINCRSLKKNFGPVTNLFNFLSMPLSAIIIW